MANKKISELQSRTPSLSDLLLVGDPSSGYSYKCTVTALATIIETDIADGYVTIGTTQTISGAKTFSNNLTLTSVSNANTDTDKFLVLNASNIVNFRTGAEVLSDIGGQGTLTLTTTGTSGAATLVSNVLNIPQYQGVISLASIGSSPNANGATLSSNTLTLQPASGSFGGVVTTGFQEFAGQKRFIGNPIQFDKHLEVKNIDSWGVSWGYTSLASKDTPVFGFLRGHSFVGTVTYYAWFTYGSTGERNYTLPSTDGTLALTSDITSSISGTANYIPKFTGSNSIGNSVIYESSSNIGIGTISPNYPLHINSTSNARIGVQGTINYSAFQNINSSGSLYWGIDDNAGANFTGTAYGRFIYSSGAYPLIFFTNSTEAMRLTASGNLGIGTTSPAAKLEIEGSEYIKTGNELRFYRTDNAIYTTLYDAGSTAANGFILNNTNGEGFHFKNGSTTIMRMNSSNNVGIGTTSPSDKLHVYQNADDNVVGKFEQAFSSRGDLLQFTNAHGTGYIGHAGDASGDFSILNASNTNTYFTTNGTERMRITSGGNVGIGTTGDASYKLLVKGNNASVDANGQNTIYLSAGASVSYLATSYIGGGSYVPIAFEVGGSERMRIASGGNVGIGTTAPQLNLHIFTSGTSFTSSTVTYSSATSRGILLDNSAGTNQSGNAIWFANSGLYSAIASTRESTGDWGTDIRFYTHPTTITNQYDVTERMRITSSGNVGIGTATAPGTNGIGLALYASDYPRLTFRNTTTGDGTGDGVQFVLANADFEMYNRESGALLFGTSNAERMRITSEGLVLIGTTSTSGVDVVRINKNGTTEYSTLNVTNSNSTAVAYFGVGGSNVANTNLRNNAYLWNAANSSLVFGTNDTLRVTIKNTGVVNISNIPTSATGLAAGDIWSDGGTLKIV